MSLVYPSLIWLELSTKKWAVVAVCILRLSLTATKQFVRVIFVRHFLWHQPFQTIILVLDMIIHDSNGCGHFVHLGYHCNSHSIDWGWGLTLVPVGGFILIFLVQVKPVFLQRIHFLILRVGVPALVNFCSTYGPQIHVHHWQWLSYPIHS